MKRVMDRIRLNGDVDDVELSDVSARARHLEAALQVFPVTEEVLERASLSIGVVVGTLDAIHLATALAAMPDLDAFVTYDDRLAQVARALGLPVVSPA